MQTGNPPVKYWSDDSDGSREMKVATVVGARPQFVKAAAVSRILGRHATEFIINTGQHYAANMSSVFIKDMGIPEPHAELGIGGGTHGQNTGRMIEAIEAVLEDLRPDWVLVYGDTDSTLAAAIAASKMDVPVAHVEAGLRSFDSSMPEEVNRRLTDHVSALLLTPTSTATQNLKREGVDPSTILQAGDVMLDAVRHWSLSEEQVGAFLRRSQLVRGRFTLATFHRPVNVDSEAVLDGIVRALGALEGQVLWPMHPRTAKRLAEFRVEIPRNVRVVDPLRYQEMLAAQLTANVVITDSGGIQKEAYFLATPCVVVRDTTEWVELLGKGTRLVGTSPTAIVDAVRLARSDDVVPDLDAFGGGSASATIVERLVGRRVAS